MTRVAKSKYGVGQQELPFFDTPNSIADAPTQIEAPITINEAVIDIDVDPVFPLIDRRREVSQACLEFMQRRGIQAHDPWGASFRRGKTVGNYSILKDIRKQPRATDVPSPEMRQLHRWLLEHPLKHFQEFISPVAHGIEGRSIGDMASQHAQSRHFMKLDLSGAYDHVDIPTLALIIDSFDQEMWQRPDSEGWENFLSRFCKSPSSSGLATGGNASPLLFNLYMRPLDDQLLELAEKYDLTYTRYMDDFVFSSRQGIIGKRKATAIKQVIRAYGFELNQRKVRYHNMDTDGPFIVTGIQINPSGNWQMPNRYLRNIRRYLEAELRSYEVQPQFGIDVETIGIVRGLHGHLCSCMMPHREPNPEETKILTLYDHLEEIYRSDPRHQY